MLFEPQLHKFTDHGFQMMLHVHVVNLCVFFSLTLEKYVHRENLLLMVLIGVPGNWIVLTVLDFVLCAEPQQRIVVSCRRLSQDSITHFFGYHGMCYWQFCYGLDYQRIYRSDAIDYIIMRDRFPSFQL